MKLDYLIFSSLFFVSLLFSCENREIGSNVGGVESPAYIEFQERSLSWNSPECESDSTKCFKIKIDYPLAVNGPEKVVRKINSQIANELTGVMDYFSETENSIRPLDTIANELIQEYSAALKEFPEYTNAWAVETTAKVIYQSKKALSVEINNYSYLGGAHPNSYTAFLNMNTDSGETIQLTDVVADTISLMKIVEKEFRKYAELGETDDLNEAGYFWGEPFQLPEQFGIKKDGLYFYYNTYEAAAYAFGPVDLLIPYEALGKLIDREKL